MTDNAEILKKLTEVIASRKGGDVKKSYVSQLFSKGRKKIAQKVGEEAVELVIAAADNDKEEAISESADLLFHVMVLWSDMGIKPEDVYGAAAARAGLWGIDERNARGAAYR